LSFRAISTADVTVGKSPTGTIGRKLVVSSPSSTARGKVREVETDDDGENLA
jgi:hypothetical protein